MSEMQEAMQLETPVKLQSDPIVTIKSLEASISESLKSQLSSLIEDPESLAGCATQMQSLALSISFVVETENAIRLDTLPLLREEKQRHLAQTCQKRGWEQNAQEKQKRGVLVLDLIHQIETLDHLIQTDVADLDDWEWNRTLRFYQMVHSLA